MTRPLNVSYSWIDRSFKEIRVGDNSLRNKEGKLITRLNNFQYIKTVNNFSTVESTIDQPILHDGYTARGYLPPGQSTKYVPASGLENLAEWPNKSDVYFALRRKIATKDWNALTDLAEIQSTVNGLAERARRIGDAYRALRRGDLGGFGKALDVSIPKSKQKRAGQVRDNISGHLLEYQFGIVPIYSSMYDGAVAIYEARQRQPVYYVKAAITNRRNYTRDTSYNLEDAFGRVFTSFKNPGGLAVETKTRSKAIAEVRIKNPTMAYLSEFGLANPLATAYAVLPNSWLFDFFYPLGGFLEQLYMPPGIEVTRTLLVDAYNCDMQVRHFYGERTHEYMLVDMYNHGYTKTQKYSVNVRGSKSSHVYIWNKVVDFPDVQVPSLKLPFLAQAITGLAYADQQSQRIKESLTKNQRRS